jgi:hypothetical protein
MQQAHRPTTDSSDLVKLGRGYVRTSWPVDERHELWWEEAETREDEAAGRRRLRAWVRTELLKLPVGHAAQRLFLNRRGTMRRGLEAGHRVSPTKRGIRCSTTDFDVHERQASKGNQVRTIEVKRVWLAPNLFIPVEAQQTLPMLLRAVVQRAARSSGTPSEQWLALAEQLKAAMRAESGRGIRFRAHDPETEWFIGPIAM